MTRMYIVRHGETQWNREEVFRGSKDIPLNETGKKQAQRVGNYFSKRHIDRIISSPLSRAIQTAEAVSSATGIKFESAKEFADMNFGIWEGLSLREVEERFPTDFRLWKASPDKLRVESGETLAMVRDRISAGLANISCDREDAVVIVTHRVICKILILNALGLGNDHFWDMKYDPGSISLLEYNNGRYTLVFNNDTCHLDDHFYPDF
jgi:broad specificity phosphatase PhoE